MMIEPFRKIAIASALAIPTSASAVEDKTVTILATNVTDLIFLGSHGTGFESVFCIRELAGMSRETAIAGAIGPKCIDGEGFDPGGIHQ